MTTSTRRQVWLLGALVTVAAVLVVLLRPSTTSLGGPSAPAAGGRPSSRSESAVGDVRLELLETRSGGRSPLERNLFRFEPRRDRTAAARVARGPARPSQIQVPTGPPAPAVPPPPPPIPLRYIGYVDQPGQVPRVGVLSDGRGNVFNGKEGDIIEGRYRVLRIGTDSADLIYVDGRGRQTIRLSGQ